MSSLNIRGASRGLNSTVNADAISLYFGLYFEVREVRARVANFQGCTQANRNEKKPYRHTFLTRECFLGGSPWLPVAPAGVQQRVHRRPASRKMG